MKNDSIFLLRIDLFDFIAPGDQDISVVQNIAIACGFSSCIPLFRAIFVEYAGEVRTCDKEGMPSRFLSLG